VGQPAGNRIVLDYVPRSFFIPFHQRTQRFSDIVAHRRCGKTVACVNDVVAKALFNKKKHPRYGYIAPTYRQGKEIAWLYLKDASQPAVARIRESELSVELINGAKITIFGADNPDSLRGLYFDGVILDEFGDMRPSLWGEVVLPTLVDRRGWAVFIGTPKGKNHFYTIHEAYQRDPSCFSLALPISITNLFTERDIAEFKAQMSDEQFRQEFMCDFTAAITGAYYAKLLETPRAGPNYNPELPVWVSSDLGFTDSSAYFFWQEYPDGPNIVDYEEADNQALAYYFDLLRYKNFKYDTIWLPHDAVAKSLQTGRSTIEQFLAEEFPVRIAPRLALQHGIDAVRKIIPVTTWDLTNPRVVSALDTLRSYHRQYDEVRKIYKDSPSHDWTSHCADAFRGLSLVCRRGIIAAPEQPKTDITQYGFTLEDLWTKQTRQQRLRV
jgi:phage terminase large subunit